MRTDLRDVYLEKEIRIDCEPLDAVSRLASSHAHQDYIVYEKEGGTWSYAGGILAEIWLDYDGAHLRGPEIERNLPWDGEPLAQLRELIDCLPYRDWRAYGWCAFELSFAKEGDRNSAGPDRLLDLIVPRTEVTVRNGSATIRAVDPTSATLVQTALLDWSVRQGAAAPRALDVRMTGREEYQAAVAQAVTDIRADVLEKVILSRTVPVVEDLDFVGTYITGRRANNPARSFLMSLHGFDALGFSPEIVVHVDSDGTVFSQPLAGTRELTDNGPRNAALRHELLSDPKEVFEHAISVKTAYDELAGICEPGSLSVQEFMTVRQRGCVQHLASQVSGRIADGRHVWDAFRAVFPAVTASGIPKEAAFAYIRTHESQPRGLYSGAVLALDHKGTLDAALVLRSLYRKQGRSWLQAGAGIVAQSTPAREFEETCEKLNSVAQFLVAAASPTTVQGAHQGAP